MKFMPTLEFAKSLDEQDKLKKFRNEFHIPTNKNDTRYFCGHSLGLMPKNIESSMHDFFEDWKKYGVDGHFEGDRSWYNYHEKLTDPMAKIVGAMPDEIITMNSLSVNLHLMLSTFWQPNFLTKKKKIIMEEEAFPSDHYAVQSHIHQRGLNPNDYIILMPLPKDHDTYPIDYIMDFIKLHAHETSLIFLGGVQYLTGQFIPIEKITQLAKNYDIKIGFDLAHAAGNVSLELHNWNVDFAIWCTYKYLNSGPGGIGGSFIHKNWVTQTSLPRLGGWWGHNKDTRFNMIKHFEPMPTAEGWQISNPPIMPLVSLLTSLEVFDRAQGMKTLREKSIQLTNYLEYLLIELPGRELQIITPKEPNHRGCQLSMKFPHNAQEIHSKLQDKNIIVDFRKPNIIRAAPVPLYNSFEDAFMLANEIKRK